MSNLTDALKLADEYGEGGASLTHFGDDDERNEMAQPSAYWPRRIEPLSATRAEQADPTTQAAPGCNTGGRCAYVVVRTESQ